VTAWGRRGDMNRRIWIMAMLLLGTLASACGNDCQTPVPVFCCVGGCSGSTLTPTVCSTSGLSCPPGSVAPGECQTPPQFCSGAVPP
jgi:hypothetical protein